MSNSKRKKVQSMTESEKKMCDDILRYGTIIDDREFVSGDGVFCRHYQIIYNDYKWYLSKNNGEWVFINVDNRKVVNENA